MALHVTKSLRPSTAIVAYCKQSNTGGGNGLGVRLSGSVVMVVGVSDEWHSREGGYKFHLGPPYLGRMCYFVLSLNLHKLLQALNYAEMAACSCTQTGVNLIASIMCIPTLFPDPTLLCTQASGSETGNGDMREYSEQNSANLRSTDW